MALSRRMFLRGGLAGSIVRIGLPPLAAMFNANGTAYAAPGRTGSRAIESRFVLWFNGNGIPEKYWIPRETGPEFQFTPCLSPLAPYRDDIHVITGLDSPAARLPGPGNSHYPSMSALVSGQPFTGRGAGGGPDSRGVVQAHAVPGAVAIPLAGAHGAAAPRIHAWAGGNTCRHADTARHLPLARGGVRLSDRQAQSHS